jgi:predicted enzyme related to lactoylglutathione lyase
MPRPVHFEIPVDDGTRAMKFYTDLFGWKFEKFPGGEQDYWLVSTGDKSEPGIDGGFTMRSEMFQGTVNTIGVDSVDAFIKKVEKAGGKIASGAQEIPGVGRFAYCIDTEGNAFGIFEDTSGGQSS